MRLAAVVAIVFHVVHLAWLQWPLSAGEAFWEGFVVGGLVVVVILSFLRKYVFEEKSCKK